MAKRKVVQTPLDPMIPPNLGGPDTNPQSVPYNPGQLEQQLGGGGEGIVPTTNQAWWDQVDLNNESAIFGTLNHPGSFARWGVEQYLNYQASQQGESKISAEEARKRYPGVEFTGDVLPSIAQYRADVINRQRTMQDFISRSPDQPGGISTGLMSIATSPLDLAGGIGVGRVAGALGKLAGLTEVGAEVTGASRAALLAGGRLVENLGGNALYQGANAALRSQQGQEIDPNAEFKSALGNAAFFTAFDALVVRPFGKYLAKRFPRDLQEQAIREGIAREEQGLPPGSPGTQATGTARATGTNQDGSPSSYTIDQAGHPSERAYYQTVGETGVPVDHTGRDVGVTYIDHPETARNAVENPEGASHGQVTEGQIDPNAKLLNLDETVGDQMALAKKIEAALGTDLKLSPTTTLQDLIDSIPHALQQKVADLVGAEGFNGYKETVSIEGEPHHTAVTVFDQTPFHPSEEPGTISGGTPEVPTDDVRLNAETPETQANYDQALVEKAKAILAELPKTPEAELSAIKEQEIQARRILGEPEESSPLAEAMESVDHDYNQDAKVRKALNGFVECFARGLQ